MGVIIIPNQFRKPFNALAPNDIVYKLDIKHKKVIPMVVKECVKDGLYRLSYRLILYKDGILSTNKVIETVKNPEYIPKTIPEFHMIIKGTESSCVYSLKEKSGPELYQIFTTKEELLSLNPNITEA